MTILASLSPRSLSAPESGIVELVNYARGREGLIPLWVGEGDLPTPDFISQAAQDSLGASVPFPKRLGQPEEFASLAVEMCRNGYFNGESVRLDGAIRMAPR